MDIQRPLCCTRGKKAFSHRYICCSADGRRGEQGTRSNASERLCGGGGAFGRLTGRDTRAEQRESWLRTCFRFDLCEICELEQQSEHVAYKNTSLISAQKHQLSLQGRLKRVLVRQHLSVTQLVPMSLGWSEAMAG